MPELAEDMYCSQQICIPPTYPYVLRQFAKAAIRTQPPDLLRWSTAYFRCLALNIPAPVKPRLEYPVPSDYYGVTPGWLRALNHQLQNNEFISFKLLWDRWMGVCLRTETLIEILCLGGFTNNLAIPWTRFIGICAAHLTQSLTESMILVCEILTEEPEGGSAMITLETFLDIYKFLGCIDASQPQLLYNLYFTDSVLDLLERVEKEMVEEKVSEETVGPSETLGEEEEMKAETEELGEEVGVVISCPDLADDDFGPDDDVRIPEESVPADETDEQKDEEEQVEAEMQMMGEEGEEEGDMEVETEGGTDFATEAATDNEQTIVHPDEQVMEEISQDKMGQDEATVTDQVDEADIKSIEGYEDEGKGEFTEDDEHSAKIHFPDTTDATSSQDVIYEPEPKPQEVYVCAIPGIGAKVPQDLMKAVASYMKQMASVQHGMVMPRNIRHYNCPPLEVLSA